MHREEKITASRENGETEREREREREEGGEREGFRR